MQQDSKPTWERTREGKQENNSINFVIFKDNSRQAAIKMLKLLSDYSAIRGEWEVNLNKKEQERVAVDWARLEKIEKYLKEQNVIEEEESQYRNLEGTLLYKKLKTWKKLSNKRIKVYEGLQRW